MDDVRGDVLRPPHGTTPAAIWTSQRQKQWDDPCVQRRLRSAWTSPPSLISLRCPSRNIESLATHWAYSKVSDQTGWMPSWSDSSLDAQVILLVWLLFSFNAHKLSFLRYVEHFRINREVMIMKKQWQWRGKHNAKKIKRCDRHYFWFQHYCFSCSARGVALKLKNRWKRVNFLLVEFYLEDPLN